jgi:hypothetical protein
MPGFDGTGPAGMGPLTGGGRGLCNPVGPRYAGYGSYRRPYPVSPYPVRSYGLGRPRRGLVSGFWGRGQGLGLGRGRGLRRGRGRGW